MSGTQSAARGMRPSTGGSAARPLAMEVDLDAIAHNLSVVRERAARGRTLIAVLKAGAYGHGAVEVARTVAAGGAGLLATGSHEEAAAVRAAGVATPIVLFGASLPEAAVAAAGAGFLPSVDSAEVVTALSQAAGAETPILIKVDGGFGRLGVPFRQARDFVSWAASQPHIKVQGIHTHPTFADAEGREWASARVREFEDLIDALAAEGIQVPITQAMTSPGVVAGLSDRLTAIAVGHLLFGLSPVADDLAPEFRAFGLRPALHAIRTQLVHVGPRPEGDAAASYLRGGVVMTGVMPLGLWSRLSGARTRRGGRGPGRRTEGAGAAVLSRQLRARPIRGRGCRRGRRGHRPGDARQGTDHAGGGGGVAGHLPSGRGDRARGASPPSSRPPRFLSLRVSPPPPARSSPRPGTRCARRIACPSTARRWAGCSRRFRRAATARDVP